MVYWMSRDQRAIDNWALIRATEVANQHNLPVVVAFFVTDRLSLAHRQIRQYDFMIRGLAETARALRQQGIGFVLRHDDPVVGLQTLCRAVEPLMVITDQDYTRGAKRWRQRAAEALTVPLEAVDAGAIVPPAVVADKQIYGAYILRPKLQKHLAHYLTDYPKIQVKTRWRDEIEGLDDQDPNSVLRQLKLETTAQVTEREPGTAAAMKQLRYFASHKLRTYSDDRNNPVLDGQSGLSPYLHFGQIAAQRVALEVERAAAKHKLESQAKDFLDELITWRELAINYCKYNNNYDSFTGLPDWAQKTLNQHADDPREYTYTFDQLEQATTHDELWNAAQREMVATGRMHGYLRMYWGKKILEWTKSPRQATAWAVRLNDTYMLDGRDPNGYAGILWAIGGLHDRPWFERSIFGQVRYMSYNGAKSKFDIPAYIKRVEAMSETKTS